MRIGEVAAAAGVPTQTVRLYERRGLLPEPARAANGYRVYDETTSIRLQFIRSAQTAGLTLAEIAGIVEIRDGGIAPCSHVTGVLEAKLIEVQGRQHQLAALEADLRLLVERGHHLDPTECTDADICHIITNPRPAEAARPAG